MTESIPNVTTPNFFVIGAQKAGTTTFFQLFSAHPQVYLPQQKEIYFFDFNYQKGMEWYLNTHFRGAHGKPAIGEVTPGYLIHPEVPARIAEACGPDTKIILLMRQPIKRAYSQYLMNQKTSRFAAWTAYPFEECLAMEASGQLDSNYLIQGQYYTHIQRYLEFFPAAQILPIIFEQFVGPRKSEVIQNICDFLGIDPLPKIESVHANRAGLPRRRFLRFIYGQHPILTGIRQTINRSPALSNWVRAALTKTPEKLSKEKIHALSQQYFGTEIQQLEAYLGTTIQEW